MTDPQTIASKLTANCPDCEGQGWVVGTDYQDGCCGGSDWECGGRGCSGPIQEPICVQEQCERCCGTGEVRTHLEKESKK